MDNLGRILTGLAFVCALALIGALAAPAMMDWTHLRGPAEARAVALLGHKVRIGGRISVRLLPTPILRLRDVDLSDDGALSGRLDDVRVRLAWRALFYGRAEPVALDLRNVDLTVSPHDWRQFGRLASLPATVRTGIIRLRGGVLEDVSAAWTPAVGRMVRLRLSGRSGGAELAVQAAFRADGNGFQPLFGRISVDGASGVASFSRATGGARAFPVEARLRQPSLFFSVLGRFLPGLMPRIAARALDGVAPVSLRGLLSAAGESMMLNDAELGLGTVRLTGHMRLDPGGPLSFSADLGAATLSLGGEDSTAGILRALSLLQILGGADGWAAGMEGHVRLHADTLLWNGMRLRHGLLALNLVPEGVRLQNLRLRLPDGSLLSGEGAPGPGLSGLVRLEPKPTGGMSPDAPGQSGLRAEGRFELTQDRAAFQNVRISAGGSHVTLDGNVFLGARPSAQIHLEADRLDAVRWGLTDEDLSIQGLLGMLARFAKTADVTVRAAIGEAVLPRRTLSDVDLDLALDPSQIVLRRLRARQGTVRIEGRLRLPVAASSEDAWLGQAEAALDLRPADAAESVLVWRASLWDGLLTVETEGGLRARLSGAIRAEERSYRWSGLSGRIGAVPLRGTVTIRPGEVTAIEGALALGQAEIGLGPAEDGPLWPETPLDPLWPEDVSVDLRLTAERLNIGGTPVSGANAQLILKSGAMALSVHNAALFGGSASGNAELTRQDGGQIAWTGKGAVDGADLAELFGNGWRGTGGIRQSTSGRGASVSEIVSALGGSITVDFADGAIGGLDPRSLIAAWPGLKSAEALGAAADKALGGGALAFTELGGTAKIVQGEIDLSGLGVQAATGPISLSGIASLPARIIAVKADIQLGNKIGAPLTVQLLGRLEAPDTVPDLSRLEQRLPKR